MTNNGLEFHTARRGNITIDFHLRRSDRRTLAISVQPDLSVVVTAPLKAEIEKVILKVRNRAGWIRRQQSYFRDFLPKTPPRQYVSGETHCYLGRQYRLKVVEAVKKEVKLKGRFIWVNTPNKADTALVQKQLENWYLGHAKQRLALCFGVCLTRLGVRLTKAPQMQVRRMDKRWGSWTRRGGVWLNPELIKTPASCIDYVVTHELCHAVHGNHGKQFQDLLRRLMPDWEKRKTRLERS